MKKIMLTGFRPFGGEHVNPSQVVAEGLAKKHDLPLLLLPVKWKVAADLVVRWIEEQKPTDVLLLGQAKGRKRVELERLGLNFCEATPDEDGFSPVEGLLNSRTQKSALFSAYPVTRWKQTLEEKNLPVGASTSAGAYICNEVYYRTLSHFPQSLFVHLPLLPEQKSAGEHPSLTLDVQLQVVEEILLLMKRDLSKETR